MDFYFGLVCASLLSLANARTLTSQIPTAYPLYPNFDNCGFNLSATCDDHMELFADENLLATSDDWRHTSVVYIPPNTGKIEIRCTDRWILGGILASSDNGLITNKAWNCSSDNGVNWHGAYELGANGVTSIDISPEAKWIWTEKLTWKHTELKDHTTAICTIQLRNNSECSTSIPTPIPTRNCTELFNGTTPIPTPKSGIKYLGSDLPWASCSTQYKTCRIDENVYGNDIEIANKTYKKGISAHAASTIEFDLDAGYGIFHACVGIANTAGTASVRFRVLGDGQVLRDWQRRNGGEDVTCFDISLSGVNILKLEADDAGDGISSDHATWADAYVYQPTQSVSGFNLNTTCNNKMELFVDGNLRATSFNWRDTSSVHIPENSQTIEIHCSDSCWLIEGILAASDNGLITDNSWNCSSDNGITWSFAHEIVPNGLSVPDISSNAKWISSGQSTWRMNGGKVICKVNLDLPTSTTTTSEGSEYTDKYVECPQLKDQCNSEEFGDCMMTDCAKTCKSTSTTTINAVDSIYFIAGGGGALRDMELYHPAMANLSCSISPPPLNNNWYYHTTFYYNNTIHLYGGNSDTASICISYSTNTEEWKTHTLSTPRNYGHSSTILNKRVFIIGGRDASYVSAESTPLPLTDRPVLTPVPNLDYKGMYQCTTKVDEDTLVITGGHYNGYLSSVIEYNAKTRTTTALPSIKQPRYTHGCAAVEMDNTKWIIVAGGYNSADGGVLETTEMLQMGGSYWEPLGNLNVARRGHSIAVTQRGVMAIGGRGTSGSLSSVELLDWSAMSWRIVQPSLSKSRRYFGGAVEIPASMFDCRGTNTAITSTTTITTTTTTTNTTTTTEPELNGYCLTSGGHDQNSGTQSLNPGHKDSCYQQCKAVPQATGCEWHNNGGCIYHTLDVATGNGNSDYKCWVFNSSPTVPTTSTTSTTTAAVPTTSTTSTTTVAEKNWRNDGRCGKSYLLPNGNPAKCNPNIGNCCSNHKWCGWSDAHCKCSGCENYAG